MKKKIFKRPAGRILAVAVLAGMIIGTGMTADTLSAKTVPVKLNKTSVTIVKGCNTGLRLTGSSKSVKWSSSNKKVAAVSAGGTVKGKSPGKATVTAKVKQKKYKCRVTVTAYPADDHLAGTYKVVKIREGKKTSRDTKEYHVQNEKLKLCRDHTFLYNGNEGKWKNQYGFVKLYGDDTEDYMILEYDKGYLIETYYGDGGKIPGVSFYFQKK